MKKYYPKLMIFLMLILVSSLIKFNIEIEKKKPTEPQKIFIEKKIYVDSCKTAVPKTNIRSYRLKVVHRNNPVS